MSRTYKPHEYAKRAGVTVRRLHHYDRLALLKPSGRTAAGYRLYADRDFVRLEQIVALKFIGFPLSQIRDLARTWNSLQLSGSNARLLLPSGTISTGPYGPSHWPKRLWPQDRITFASHSGNSSR
jgi:DNA-binding transcriptional MerR regulator